MRPLNVKSWTDSYLGSRVRRTFIALTLVATTMVALPVAVVAGFSGSAWAKATTTITCNTGFSNITGTQTGNLVVPAGDVCRFFGGEVTGNVTAYGELDTTGVQFDGNVSVPAGGSFAGFNFGDTIQGNLLITGSYGTSFNGCCGTNGFGGYNPGDHSVIDGNFSYTGNFTALIAAGPPVSLEVKGNFTYSNNQNLTFQGQSNLSGLQVKGKVTCDGSNLAACPLGGQ